MSIRMDQPRPFDLVGSPVLIARIGTGLRSDASTSCVHDGHDEVTGPITVGGGTGEHAQFQVKANVAARRVPARPRLRRSLRGEREGRQRVAQDHAAGPARLADGQGPLHRLPRARRQAGRHAHEDRQEAQASTSRGSCAPTRTRSQSPSSSTPGRSSASRSAPATERDRRAGAPERRARASFVIYAREGAVARCSNA